MTSRQEAVDDFTHDLAIELSRSLNLTNPNDLLAKRVIQLAKNDPSFDRFAAACQTFGRFKREFLFGIFNKIDDYLQHKKFYADDKPGRSQQNSNTTQAIATSEGTRGEVLRLGNNMPGGLITRNKSSKSDDVSPPTPCVWTPSYCILIVTGSNAPSLKHPHPKHPYSAWMN
ncbi:hypothetical protein BCR43DRAFT_362554 [Syncephalastrum racemosum]|uniref:Uncharacterized protein n=1 Tax=Syncephalastrum racemosum TaxID=13706 RepID=A0A1X2H3N7_SYNRA|nr:hypothetical protein BCR43DRAFT_362554 [Syncephalastrum racemosum]